MCAVTTQPLASRSSTPFPTPTFHALARPTRWPARYPPTRARCRPSRTVWIGAGGIACFAYYQAAGGWPDLTNPDDQAKVGAAPRSLTLTLGNREP